MHLRDWALNSQHRGKVEAYPPANTWLFVRSVLSRNPDAPLLFITNCYIGLLMHTKLIIVP